MSFQGIRKMRETHRESPFLLESQQIRNKYIIKPIQINLDVKPFLQSHDIRSTKDSEIKVQTVSPYYKKNSYTRLLSSKDKQKKITPENYLRINLDGLNHLKQSRQLKNTTNQTPKAQRISRMKKKSEDYEKEELSLISLNSFDLNFVVGKGGFGKVWKVVEKSTKKVYAMKQMQKAKIISKRSVHSVMNEQSLLKSLKNPFLVNMYYSFQNRETLFLVMDYCNRGDLRYHLGNRRKFKEEQTRFFLACIILCLQYMHKQKVIHRDLKPQNLVIDDDGYIRVTDLGVSREVKANNAQDTSGTPGYMAPQVICKMNHSFPVDYYALGVMAFQFMTGRRPYLGANRQQIRQKIVAKQVQLGQIPPHGWSKESVDFINRLIQRRPQDRLGYNGIEEIKYHPFFKKLDWEVMSHRRLLPPFLPEKIEEDFINYQECISEDTLIKDIQEYRMVLRRKQTQEVFIGYDFNTMAKNKRKRPQSIQLQIYTQLPSSFRRRK